MAETRVARRYAKSLLGLGIENNIIDSLFNDMLLIQKTIRENRALGLLFKNPIINTDKKDKVIAELFGSRINKITLEFLKIITRKKREYYVEDIAASFVEIYKYQKGIRTASVITASPLTDDLRKQMLDLIHRTTDNEIELKEIVDPSIIGGYILRWGDQQVDASVTKKLHDLKQEFSSNLYLKDY